jgi:Tol biopolymer transport system component
MEYPAWSRNGRQIAFALASNADRPEPEIGIVNTDGRGLHFVRVPADLGGVEDLDWSPDGRRFAFVATRADLDFTDIYVMNADGTGLKRLHSGTNTPRWSRDGQSLLVVDDDRLDLLAPTSARTTAIPGVADPLAASWSSDGTRIAYASLHDGLHIVDLTDGDNQRVRLRPSICAGSGVGCDEIAWQPAGT